MTKNVSEKSKPHIRQRDFSDRNISSIEQHVRDGKKLLAPFTNAVPMTFVSWKDDCIPNILWACVLAGNLERDHYLHIFREVAANARGDTSTAVVHNHMAAMAPADFRKMFGPVIDDPVASDALSALMMIESLPDRAQWEPLLKKPNLEKSGDILAKGILACIDHQSIPATDVRWLKLVHHVLIGKMFFAETMRERSEELRLYPDKGDQRSVRPFIRSSELMLREFEHGSTKPPNVPAARQREFWIECYQKTECILVHKFDPPKLDTGSLLDDVTAIALKLSEHFDASHNDAGFDPRRDGAFGLIMYALTLTYDIARAHSHIMPTGRIVLRSVVELFITLKYLSTKDDPTLWAQYRNYGSGQAKLAFLKFLREEDVPEFVDLAELENLANEDMWLEFQDVSLGAWANSDLRKMSTEASCKDVYDKYYGWTSGFSHGQWVCVRDSVFTTCLNPLHRLHRVPGAPRDMPSVLKDCCALINRMLDELSALYSPFKPRLTWHKAQGVAREKHEEGKKTLRPGGDDDG